VNPARGRYVVAVLLAATGVALRLTPISRPVAEPGHPLTARVDDRAVSVAAQSPGRAATNAADDPIIAANIFSQSRRPPTRQSALAGAPATHRPTGVSPLIPSFTLYGTTIGPRGAVALITTRTRPDDAQVHFMGDTIAGARLVAITESTVTLLRASGPLVLHVLPDSHQTP
jgi:hypothetical protein